MTHPSSFTLPEDFLEAFLQDGAEVLPRLLQHSLNAMMLAERQAYLQAAPYQRIPERRDHANGFKPKTLKTRLGPLTVQVPQMRRGKFYPSVLTKGLRSERALWLTLAEMYVFGVSTRKVSALVEKTMGVQISSTSVSKAARELDEVLQAWRERPLDAYAYPYLYLDAHYEHVRIAGRGRDVAVLKAVGVRTDGKRTVLGVSVALSEQEVHWRTFLQSLVQRGLRGVQLIISDDHTGLRAARQAVFGAVPWQRCQFHLHRKDMQAEVAHRIREIFDAPHRAAAEQGLKQMVADYQDKAPRLAAWLETNLAEGFTVFDFPANHRRRLRTSNVVERLHREIRRRSRAVGIFPDEAACLRLISAVLMEQSEAWETGRVYLKLRQESPSTS